MACESSDWASVNVELLSEALTRVPLRSKVACECVCKAWRRTLGNKPSEGIWGDMVSLQSLLCRPAVLDLSGNNVLISQPPLSSHSDSLAKWVVKRIDGIKQVVLGHPKPRSVLATLPLPDPADDGSFSSTGPLLHLLSTTNVDEGLEVAIFQLDPTLLLDEDCLRLLQRHCVGLTLKSGPVELSSQHLQALCSLTDLKFLELESNMMFWPQPVETPDLPPCLTQLTRLHTLTALSFPALPADFCRLQHLCRLYLAPSQQDLPHDLSAHTHLTELHIGTRYTDRFELTLPSGPEVKLRNLILQCNCHLRNLEDAQQLRSLEIVPVLGTQMVWPASLPQLTRLIVDDPAELHGFEEVWGALPEQWQNYTALRQLTIPDLVLNAMPEWLTSLSELRILEMQNMSFQAHMYFPTCLRNMPKLQVLNMERLDAFIVEEVVCLADIPNLCLLIFGCIGQDVTDEDPDPPLDHQEVQAFQQLAVALAAHPNKLIKTALSQSSDQIWTFRASKHGLDPHANEYLIRYNLL